MLLAPMAVIYGYSFAFFRNRFRERQILANGELASGFVTAQDNGRYTQSIHYYFRLAGGKLRNDSNILMHFARVSSVSNSAEDFGREEMARRTRISWCSLDGPGSVHGVSAASNNQQLPRGLRGAMATLQRHCSVVRAYMDF